MDSAFLFLLLAVFSGCDCTCLLSASISSKMNAKEFFPGSAMASKQAFFCYFSLAIALQPAVLWLFLSQ
jgi:hypothetical protein